MKAQYIYEAFEEKSKEEKKKSLLFPEYTQLAKDLKIKYKNIRLNGKVYNIYNIQVSGNGYWKDIYIFANVRGLLITSYFRIYDEYDWENPKEEHRQKMEEKKERIKREEEFFDIFKDILIESLYSGTFHFLPKKKIYGGTAPIINGEIGNKKLFYKNES